MSYLLVAIDQNKGIGHDNDIPWKGTEYGKKDLKYFRIMTYGKAVLMGWNTYKSINRLLPGRHNIIITNDNYDYAQDFCAEQVNLTDKTTFKLFKTLKEGIKYARDWEVKNSSECYIIGGEKIYREYLQNYNYITAFVSVIPGKYLCNKFLDIAPGTILYDTISRYENAEISTVQFLTIENETIKQEKNYLDLFHKTLSEGHEKSDRTGTGTISLFAPPELRFSLANDNLPVITTKSIPLKTCVIPELLWFMRGQTDTRILESQGCNIWRGNTTKEFLENRGLSYKEKDMGPGYGFQWRHSGADYHGMECDYTGQGVDQLAQIIDCLRTDPDSRRMLMVSWTAPYIKDMALPPCHVLYQVYSHVDKFKRRCLSAKMYQRSADSFLGVPFNITSYAILTHLLAKLTGHVAHELILTFGDYHIYKNHIDQIKEQSIRIPRGFPKIIFNDDLLGKTIEDVTADSFTITNYSPQSKIVALMAV